ncbi:unnamed protein product [Orchesella dallaii]|uniref:BTB domain-containing protein n=1 Tax=Orchesella dallaii TaxID=48710 RepID=A0ABP1RAM1_9HEXA
MTHRFVLTKDGDACFIQPRLFRDGTYFVRIGCTEASFLPTKEDISEESKEYSNKVRMIIDSRHERCSLRETDFDVYLKVKTFFRDETRQSRLFGCVHGRVFKELYEEMELLEPMKMRLKIGFGFPLNSGICSGEMSFIEGEDSKKKRWPKVYKFQQDLKYPWPVPGWDSWIPYRLKAELIFSPYSQPGLLGMQPPSGGFEIAVMTKQILESQFRSDFVLISEDGDRLSCHQIFLASASPFFSRMVQTDMKESNQNQCKLQGSTKEGLSALLKFIYYQDVQEMLASSTLCVEALHIALLYDIPTLANWVRDTMLWKPTRWWDLEGAVNLFLRVRLEDGYENLKEKAVQIVKTKNDEFIASSNTLFEDLCDNPKALKELMRLLSMVSKCSTKNSTIAADNITSIDDGSVRPRLLGTVHGPLFKNISEELELLEPVQLKLEIAFGVPFCTSVSSEEMSFIQNPKDKQVPTTYYSFEKDMITPPTWPWPLPCCDTGIEYYLMSTLIFSPYSHPGIQVSPPPQNGSLQIASMTKLILESGLHSDFTLISGTGDRFPCHKVFLTPSSQFFATMFRTDMMERKMNECRLDGSSKDGVRALLKFVYYQDVLEPLGSSGLCVELLHLALLYDIPTLAHWARDNMLLKPNCWWDIEGVVSLYFRVRLESGYESLKEKAIQILKTKRARGELMSNSNSNFQELCMGDPNALKELMQLMFCSM